MSEYRLTEEIINLSEAQVWDQAKLEWKLQDIHRDENPNTCLCGHFPIIEICTLRNIKNKNLAVVGNCCVKKFMGLESDKIFQAIRRVRKDEEKSLNAEAIEHAYEKNWITEWEHGFYLNIMRKRNLSPKQATKKLQINQKILSMVVRP